MFDIFELNIDRILLIKFHFKLIIIENRYIEYL